MRAWRPKYRDLSPVERRKSITRSKSNVFQKRGKLEKKPCQECGSLQVEKHHKDYADAMDVVWLCIKCHKELHYLYERHGAHGAPSAP